MKWYMSSLIARGACVAGILSVGVFKQSVAMRCVSYAGIVVSCFSLAYRYVYKSLLSSKALLNLNLSFISCVMLFALLAFLYRRYHKAFAPWERRYIPTITRVGLVLLVCLWLRANIIAVFDKEELPGSWFMSVFGGYTQEGGFIRSPLTNALLTTFYLAYAIVTILVSMRLSDVVVRVIGMAIAAIGLVKIGMLILKIL